MSTATAVWYLAPIVLVAACYGIFLLARRDAHGDKHHHHPAE